MTGCRVCASMITLLTGLVVAEGLVAVLLMTRFDVLRRLVMKGMQCINTGKGRAMVTTLGSMMLVLLASTTNSIFKIQKRLTKLGTSTYSDQYLLCTYFLEASLLGFALFLGLVINRLHHYLSELLVAKVNTETLKKQAKATEIECLRLLNSEHLTPKAKTEEDKELDEIRSLRDTITELTEKLKELQLETEAKDKAAKAAQANATALQKQSEGFLLEYDRLLADNQHLRSQLESLDRRFSHSDSKKNQ